MKKDITYLIYMISCLNGVSKTYHFNSEHLAFKTVDEKAIFFMSRITDRRYYSYGDRINITLSVGDSIENNLLPTIYEINFKNQFINSEDSIEALIENFDIHMEFKNFIKIYKLENLFETIPSEKGYKHYLRKFKINNICGPNNI